MKGVIFLFCCFLLIWKIEAQSILLIQSRPDGVNVFINDSLLGKTPIEISNPKRGHYGIRLEDDKQKIWRTNLYIEPDSSYQIYAILDGNYGLFTLYTNPPKADVYLNDSLIGKTPLNAYEVEAGPYNIKITKENYLPWERYIYISPRLQQMKINLLNLFGKISFNNISSDQSVYVDGELLHSNNLNNLIIPIGDHRIQLLDRESKKEIFDNIEIDSDNHYDIFFKYDEFSFKPLVFSAVLPGLGQIYNKSYLMGTLILISTIANGYAAFTSITNYNQKMDEYNSFQKKYLSTETEEDAIYYRSMTENAYSKVNSASTLKSIFISTLIGIYLYNLLDAVLFNSKIDVMYFYEQESKYKIQQKNDLNKDKVNLGFRWNF
jgi:hypothetical protein